MVRDQRRFTLFCDTALEECRKAQNDLDQSSPEARRKDIFYHLFRGIDPETGQSYTEAELEAESRLLVVAGSDTSSTALATCCFYLVRNKPRLGQVDHGNRGPPLPIWKTSAMQALTLPNLPYLRACLDKTLRIRASTPGHIPREVGPGGGVVSEGMFLPQGTVVRHFDLCSPSQ